MSNTTSDFKFSAKMGATAATVANSRDNFSSLALGKIADRTVSVHHQFSNRLHNTKSRGMRKETTTYNWTVTETKYELSQRELKVIALQWPWTDHCKSVKIVFSNPKNLWVYPVLGLLSLKHQNWFSATQPGIFKSPIYLILSQLTTIYCTLRVDENAGSENSRKPRFRRPHYPTVISNVAICQKWPCAPIHPSLAVTRCCHILFNVHVFRSETLFKMLGQISKKRKVRTL